MYNVPNDNSTTSQIEFEGALSSQNEDSLGAMRRAGGLWTFKTWTVFESQEGKRKDCSPSCHLISFSGCPMPAQRVLSGLALHVCLAHEMRSTDTQMCLQSSNKTSWWVVALAGLSVAKPQQKGGSLKFLEHSLIGATTSAQVSPFRPCCLPFTRCEPLVCITLLITPIIIY